ncbi:MAG: hypothetical protein ICV66_08325, partial [Chitinophagaceae bacterium]|nr:hypothetical protein [Chitinophagaceae bacterium]
MKPNFLIALAALVISYCSFAQDTTAIIKDTTPVVKDENMLKILGEEEPQKEYVHAAFKSSRVIMSHSMEMLRPGVLDFRILHRFGNINQGAYQFFGLDQATIRLGLDYAFTEDFTVGVGRGTNRKEFDGFIKYRLIHQATGPNSLPFSLVLAAGSTLQTLKWVDSNKHTFSDRVAYY